MMTSKYGRTTRRNLSPSRSVLLLGVFFMYYMWLFSGTEESGDKNLLATDKLLTRLDFVSPDHFESGVHETKVQLHPFDEPRAHEIKTQLHAKPSDVHKGGVAAHGANMLHALADDKLFLTAINSDQRARQQMATQGVGHADLRGKIAFMFLGERDLPLEPVWNKFLQGNVDRYNIYVHLNPSQPSVLKGVFWGRSIPSMAVKPNTPGFIAAARRLMANAILDDPQNEWFALMSDACIPLHSFHHIYKTLESTNKSHVEINSKKFPVLWRRYVARGMHAMEPEVSWANFKMGSKWWILRKRHARMVVEDKMYWNKFNLPCLPDHRTCVPEEHYFSTVLSMLDKNGSTGKAVTFQSDKAGLQSDKPNSFRCSQISATFFSTLQAKDKGQWLFAQKFNVTCIEKLLFATRKIYTTELTERAVSADTLDGTRTGSP